MKKSIFDVVIETAKGLGDKKLIQELKNLKKKSSNEGGASSIDEMPIVKLKKGVRTYKHDPSKYVKEYDEKMIRNKLNKNTKK